MNQTPRAGFTNGPVRPFECLGTTKIDLWVENGESLKRTTLLYIWRPANELGLGSASRCGLTFSTVA